MFSNRTLDEASRLEQLERDAAVQAIRARIPTGESARVCCNPQCGREIPEARRQAVPGCRYCIHCQARLDRNTQGI
ncbi:TraR/DksA C4-type zinc finger protein [Ralstonia pseudosolanacearum]